MEVKYFDTDVAVALHELTVKLLSYVGGGTLLILIAVGIYYMASSGDPGRQQRAKQAFVYALIGLIIVLLSYVILGTINKLAT
jgi:multisubunit Na+/H+ antiporter MnhB subunit